MHGRVGESMAAWLDQGKDIAGAFVEGEKVLRLWCLASIYTAWSTPAFSAKTPWQGDV